MTKLLINEPPLVVLPSLATLIGLNEALFLQQVHYWLDPRINKNLVEGKNWVYNSYGEWNEQFPFWSEITIRRIISSLENLGLLISKNLNSDKFDKRKWYTIDYEKIDKLTKGSDRSDQNEQIDRSTCTDDLIKMSRSYNRTKITTKTTTENNSLSDKHTSAPITKSDSLEREMINIWNKEFSEGKEIIKLTPERSKLLGQTISDFFTNDLSQWRKFCQLIKTSDFLMGKSKVSNFKVSIDWVLKPEIIQKILEGDYNVKLTNDDSTPKIQTDDIEEGNPIWLEVKSRLKAQYGQDTYKSWFAGSKLIFREEGEGRATLIASSRFIKEYIEAKYLNTIAELLRDKGINDIKLIDGKEKE